VEWADLRIDGIEFFSGAIMKRLFLKSMIHSAKVVEANIDYIGSITIDEELMEKALLTENETVYVVDRTNGNRIKTYVIKGERGIGIIGMNGAAAHLIKDGDVVDIMSFVVAESSMKPLVVSVDEKNMFAGYINEF